MQMVEDQIGDDKVLSERQLTPLEGTKGKVWVLTGKMSDSGTGSLKDVRDYRGVMTRFKDFDKNLDSYIEDFSLKKIKRYLKKRRAWSYLKMPTC